MGIKRGQVTIFIIIGVSILVIVGALFYIRGSSVDLETQSSISDEVEIDTSSLSAFISTCARQTAQDAVDYTAFRGGKDVRFDQGYQFAAVTIPYYFYEGENRFPTMDEIRQTLQDYMNENIKLCTNGFETFKQQGYDIEESEISSTATIAEEEVIFEIQYPVTLVKGSSRQEESSFSTSVDANLLSMITTAEEYIQAQEQNPEAFRIKHMVDIVSDSNLEFEVIEKEEGSVIISLIDENTIINANPLLWSFAIKYDWD
ncbi:hypothetical protein GF345_00420 [Candidatus Woesearchaeota archaeon]|nr:hypothetical protein [Candidatus Woesearchaeota archaeon]